MKLPITIFLILIMICASSSVLTGRTYTVIRERGGPDGYRKVIESHDASSSSLECYDPGYTTCGWVQHPYNRPRLIGYADQKIADGILNGIYWEIHNGVRYTVEWVAIDSYNVRITETQEQASGVE